MMRWTGKVSGCGRTESGQIREQTGASAGLRRGLPNQKVALHILTLSHHSSQGFRDLRAGGSKTHVRELGAAERGDRGHVRVPERKHRELLLEVACVREVGVVGSKDDGDSETLASWTGAARAGGDEAAFLLLLLAHRSRP